jgi:hypothetical protein
MGGGGGDKLEITGEQKKDPATAARERHLWEQAQKFAATSPFTSQYGGPSAMPGMGAMSQQGQQYLTDAILGPGQYQAKNLGFTDYQRPESAAEATQWDYEAPTTQRYTPPDIYGDGEFDDGGFDDQLYGRRQQQQDLEFGDEGFEFDDQLYGRRQQRQDQLYGRRQQQRAQQQAQQSITPQMESQYATLQAQMQKEGEAQRADPRIGMSMRSPGEQKLLQTFRTARPSPQEFGPPEEDYQLPPPGARAQQGLAYGSPGQARRQLQNLPMQGLLGQRDVAESPTVGIGEMEMGALATRRMLEQGGPATPEFDRITDPTIGTTTVGDVTDITAETIGAPTAVDVGAVTAPELAGVEGAEVERITGRDIAGPAALTIDPVTGQTTEAVGGVAPGEFGGASFLGGPEIQDYMNQAGVEAQIAQSEEDYQRQLNQLQAQQAGTGAFGARAQLEDLGALEGQQRNIAAIRGAGYERAAGMMEADIGRQQQAGMQTQQLGAQTGMAGQALEAQRRESDAARAQQAALAGQQLGTQAGMQTQQLQQQAAIQGAQNALTAAQANQQAMMQSGTQEQQLEAARQIEEARLGLSAAQQTQQLGAQAGMQTQQLGTQVDVQNAQNALSASQANLNAAVQSGDQQAQIDAQRQMAEAQMGLDAATRNQAAGLQASELGLDAQGQFRGQQLAAAQQLADIGGMEQDATFGAASQLQQMGAQQEQTQRLQQAWDYEQWLRGQEGGAESLALMQSMMPGGAQQQWSRRPDRFGQILGAATSLGGAALAGSDVRMKDNIKYAGVKNGFNLYEFNYLGSDNRYRGVMAQEVMKQRPDAVESRNGVYWVNYGALGIQLEAV